jgi:hypothetical protein
VDGAVVVVKSVSLPALIGRCQIATEIENLFNLPHPLITPLIGFVFLVESAGRLELKTAIARLVDAGCEGESGCGDCTSASVCAPHRTAPLGGDGGERPFRCE